MTKTYATANEEQRRAGVRRTVWIVAGMALAMYLLFFLKQAFWH
jgi:hypothetical protein